MLGTCRPQQIGLLVATHDIDQGDAVGLTEPVEHLAEVRRRRRVHDRRVPFETHRLGHAERRERVDER